MNEALTPRPVKLRLCLMMFLQYFVQGCYLPIISVYLEDALGFNGLQVGIFQSALAIGPLLAPFLLGQLVDRVFATEKVLTFCHLTAGLLMIAIYFQTEVVPVVVLGTFYAILYVPTLMLTNALAFHHLRQSAVEFPSVRVWGTIGFVVPAWLIEYFWLSSLSDAELKTARGIALLLSGGSQLIMALYCLTLPHTPPKPDAPTRFAPGAVVGLLRRRDFQVLVIGGLFLAICHNFFFVQNSPFLRDFREVYEIQGAWAQRWSSTGQICEILVIAMLGWGLRSLGFRRVLTLGATAYMVRCVIFAIVPTLTLQFELPFPVTLTVVLLGQALHGFCFGCFWAVGFIYVDKMAPPDIRGSMQTFYGTFVFGTGMFLGGLIGGAVSNLYRTESLEATTRLGEFSAIWLWSAAIGAVGLAIVWLFFPMSESMEVATPPPTDVSQQAEA